MTGPYRFLIVDSVGYTASWTKSSKPKASFGQGFLYSACVLGRSSVSRRLSFSSMRIQIQGRLRRICIGTLQLLKFQTMFKSIHPSLEAGRLKCNQTNELEGKKHLSDIWRDKLKAKPYTLRSGLTVIPRFLD